MPTPISASIAAAIRASEPEPFETDYSGIAVPRSSDSENDRRARFNCSADL
ncbi:hypothetical protein Bra5_CH00864 [Rhizobium phaseoli Brasil 5]|jgi:hypothetical protein|nr:hypothetical protein Bra5_CH00864 [Rhizobium phaseoli Brasil 5]